MDLISSILRTRRHLEVPRVSRLRTVCVIRLLGCGVVWFLRTCVCATVAVESTRLSGSRCVAEKLMCDSSFQSRLMNESVYCTEDRLGKWGDLVTQGYAESIRE